MMTIQPKLNMFHMIYDNISVLRQTTSKNTDFIELRHILQKLEHVWSDEKFSLVIVACVTHFIMNESLV